jgi:hypothetical protein
MKDYTDIVKERAKFNLLKAVRMWGLERTEDKIKDLYKKVPTLRDFMLNLLHNEVWKNG